MYVQLKEDSELTIQYDCGFHEELRDYPKGEIFFCEIRKFYTDKNKYNKYYFVYLDDDGDGEILIPERLVEEVSEDVALEKGFIGD